MTRRLLSRLLRQLALDRNQFVTLWRVIAVPTAEEWTDYQRRWGGFRHVGDHVMILPGTTIPDPYFVWLGNNVVLSICTLVGHDGSIAVMNRAYAGEIVDAVGPVIVKDNVFIGFNAVVLPGVTIGPDAIVAAGAVVTSDVAPGTIVGGVPARVIGQMEELLERRRRETKALPWYELLKARGPHYPPLRGMRADHFFREAEEENASR